MLLTVLGLAWCGWASAFRAGTRDGQWSWLVSLLLVLLAALAVRLGRSRHRLGGHVEAARPSWPGPETGGTRRALAATAPWLVLGVIVLAWEILGIDTGRHEPHLTISALSLAFRPLRAAMLAVWMGVGVCFALARARSADGRANRRNRGGPDSSRAAGAAGVALAAGRLAGRAGSVLALLEGRSRAVGVGFWVGVLLCAAGIELAARRSGGRIASFEDLLAFLSRPLAARIALVAAWTYAGWHLFAH